MLNRAVSKKIAKRKPPAPASMPPSRNVSATTRSMFDAHERGGLGVLGGGADAPAEPAAAHEPVERHHQDDRGHEDEHLVGADLRRRRW